MTLTVPNMSSVAGTRRGIEEGDLVTVTIYPQAGITAPATPGKYVWSVGEAASTGDNRVEVGEADVTDPDAPTPTAASLDANSKDPGKNTRYTIMFTASGGGVDAGTQELVIELEDFGFPSSVDSDDVTIRVKRGGDRPI